jgi:hypothetical protein
MRNRTLLAFAGAAAFLVQPQLAAAQQACLAEDEVSAMAVYAVPGMVRAMQLTCAAGLSQDGWLARDGGALASRYSGMQGRVWPKAKAALLKVVNGRASAQGIDPQAAQTLALVANLPDENVRPLVDALIVQQVSAKIPVADCGKIERVMAAIAPIEPEVAGTLIAATAGLFADKAPLICPARAS